MRIKVRRNRPTHTSKASKTARIRYSVVFKNGACQSHARINSIVNGLNTQLCHSGPREQASTYSQQE
ncbi:hypothetical protein, partial [Erwinia amylovora]|uniref:hypothetical protein n=1 Tax=Erwinia amylovora TaxID=552 RepID=UPI0020BEC465